MRLLVFGLGFSASHFVRLHGDKFASVAGTFRSTEAVAGITSLPGVERLPFDGLASTSAIEGAIANATHILTSIAPDAADDPVLRLFGDGLRRAPDLSWVGYLSTVGVYGDAGGAWVDETAPIRPTLERNAVRARVEQDWRAFGAGRGVDVQVFRLSGIYGPGRNAVVNLRRGTARRIVKPGQVFNRVHVADIAGAVMAGIGRPKAGPFFNVTDNEPAPPQDVVAYAAERMGVAPPPEIAYDAAQMSPMARSFYGENKRVSNRLMREALGHEPLYPTYREGIGACLDVDG